MTVARLRLLVLGAAMALLAFQAARLAYTVDDAFISFRYARNLVDGHGLTYNPGGERVEGYTNFLWTLLAAAAIAAGLDPVTAAHALGLGAGLATLWLSERLARRLGAVSASALAPALLCANPAFVTWTSGGLETALFAALVLWGALAVSDPASRRWTAGAAFALASLTRPEGALTAALAGLGLLAAGGRAGLRRLAPSGVLVAAVVLAHEAWRVAYYGAWLPNTFHAKTGDLGAQVAAGSRYVLDGLAAFAGGPFALLVVALGAAGGGAAGAVSASLALGFLGYVVLVGGDGLPMYRFLVPALPLLAALAARALERALGTRPRLAASTAAAAVALTALIARDGQPARYRDWDRTEFVPKVVRVGRALRGLVGPDATIALLPAGAIPYYSGLETIDMLALNDPVVARKKMRFVDPLPGHWKHDAAEVLRRRPDYVLLGNVDVTPEPRDGPIPPAFRVEADLLALDGFAAGYGRVSFPLPGGGWLNAYRRRDAASR